MSWSSYIDTLLRSKAMEHCVIAGFDGNVWAGSPNFPLDKSQITLLAKSLKDPQTIQTEGIKVGDDKYTMVRAEDNCLIFRSLKLGMIVYGTQQACLIALHGEGQKTETCNTAMGRVVDFLVKKGY
ncbi:hypothetical protein SNEBB_010134 [Seison nebaliae]|nr:hypothetical protein SNEBB_010134 [Seison nebaliae]